MRDSKSQNSMIKAVLFDMDNTLHHLDAAVLAAADAVFCYCKEEFAASLSLLSCTASEREDAVIDCLRGLQNPVPCLWLYQKLEEACTDGFPETGAILRELKNRGCKLAVFTKADGAEVIPRLQMLGLLSYFDAVYTGEYFAYRKPVHNPYAEVLLSLGFYADEGAFVDAELMERLRDHPPEHALPFLEEHVKTLRRTNIRLRRIWKY